MLQDFTLGKRAIDCVILDGNLGDPSRPLADSFDSGEGIPVIPGKKRLFGFGKTDPVDPNLIALDFMQDDRKPGSDARNVLRLIATMRERGQERWDNLAVVGYSGDPMAQILKGTGLEVDFDLGKRTDPTEIINAIHKARINRLGKIA